MKKLFIIKNVVVALLGKQRSWLKKGTALVWPACFAGGFLLREKNWQEESQTSKIKCGGF